MFYAETWDDAFRLGDIVRGFAFASPVINNPQVSSFSRLDVSINMPPFCAILTPCCSISGKVITLSPLIEIPGAIFKNPYFAEDPTRINLPMKPEHSLPPDVWEQLSGEERERRLAVGETYGFVDYFIFDKHDLLPPYTINRKGEDNLKVNYYMIDFRSTFQIQCDKIVNPKQVPMGNKYLQLSREARKQLREKFAAYISRVPAEDMIE